MKKLLIGLLALSSLSVFAQSGVTSIGAKTSKQTSGDALLHGAVIQYRSNSGVYIPVSVQFGSGIERYVIGAGFKTGDDFLKDFSYAVNAALSNINFDERYDFITPEDRKRTSFLIQQEISFELSKRFSLGFSFDLDLGSLKRIVNAQDATSPKDFRNENWIEQPDGTFAPVGTGRWGTPYYKTDAEKDLAVRSAKASSSQMFGVSLKFNLGKNKN